jgi:CRP-like cAMP-binding protein
MARGKNAQTKSNRTIAKRTFPPGSVLCKQGEPCTNIYLLLNGTVNVSVESRIVQVIDKSGSFIGELGPLINQPSVTTLTTATECDCIVIPIKYLEDIIATSPEDRVNLLGILATHLLQRSDVLADMDIDLDSLTLGDRETAAGRTAGQEEQETGTRRIVLVAKEDKFIDLLRFHFTPMGFEVSYSNEPDEIIKNLDDLDPDLVIFNSVDFPRHWKPLLSLLREKRSIEEAVFILITGEDFTLDEAAKAAYLKVNGIIPENLLEKKVLFQLNDLVRRYKNLSDKRRFSRVVPHHTEVFRLLFTHPIRNSLISGVVSDISLEGSNFIPNDPDQTADLPIDQRIEGCSLRVGEHIITVNCRVARNRRELGLEFESFEADGHQKLFKYLMERPERDMKQHIQKGS